MKKHMLICFFISMLVGWGKEWEEENEWGSYKMEIIMKKEIEIVKLENEVVDMLKIIIIIRGYTLNNFTTHITIL